MKAMILKRLAMVGLLAGFCLPKTVVCQPNLGYDPHGGSYYEDVYYYDEYYYDEYYEEEYCCDDYYYDDGGWWGLDLWFGGP